MVDISYNLAKYLADSGFGTLATDIFINQMPNDTNGIWIERAGGQLNNYVPIEETVLDIYSKDIKSELALEKLESIKQFIHRMYSKTIGTTYAYTMLIIGDIQPIQIDQEYAKIYKITVQIVHHTNLIS